MIVRLPVCCVVLTTTPLSSTFRQYPRYKSSHFPPIPSSRHRFQVFERPLGPTPKGKGPTLPCEFNMDAADEEAVALFDIGSSDGLG
jgi:hypothetical protein